VVITHVEPNSPAQEEGLQRGDVIIEVEHEPVKDMADFTQYIERNQKQKKNTLLLTVRVKANNYRTLFVVLKKQG
jgi:serine protease Do